MKRKIGTNNREQFNVFNSWEVDNDNILAMECTCGACPLQFEGVLKDNSCFYFRDRHDRMKFAIANTVDDAVCATRKTSFYYKEGKADYTALIAAKKISKWVNDYFKKKMK